MSRTINVELISARHVLFDKQVEIFLYGRPTNWRPSVNPTVAETIYQLADGLKVQQIWAPIPDFSARVANHSEMLPEELYPFKHTSSILLMRGVEADAVEIPRGHAFCVFSADCPTLILYDPLTRRLICGHAGKNSVLDMSYLAEDSDPRKHESVVDAMLASFSHTAIPRLHAYISLGIAGSNYKHPLKDVASGRRYQTMVEYVSKKWGVDCFSEGPLHLGCLSISTLLRQQLVARGLSELNIEHDGYDTFGDKNQDSTPRWWSNRRPDNGKSRNMVFVVNGY